MAVSVIAYCVGLLVVKTFCNSVTNTSICMYMAHFQTLER